MVYAASGPGATPAPFPTTNLLAAGVNVVTTSRTHQPLVRAARQRLGRQPVRSGLDLPRRASSGLITTSCAGARPRPAVSGPARVYDDFWRPEIMIDLALQSAPGHGLDRAARRHRRSSGQVRCIADGLVSRSTRSGDRPATGGQPVETASQDRRAGPAAPSVPGHRHRRRARGVVVDHITRLLATSDPTGPSTTDRSTGSCSRAMNSLLGPPTSRPNPEATSRNANQRLLAGLHAL